MRVVSLIVAVLTVSLAAPGALACHPVSLEDVDPDPPPGFWLDVPAASELEPGEVAIRATFNRHGVQRDPRSIDFERLPPPPQDIIIITCNAFPVFNLVEGLAGEVPAERTVQVYGYLGQVRFSPDQDLILVGRLYPLKT